MTPTPAWYEADADDSDRNVTDDITAGTPQEPRGAILPAREPVRGFSDADLLRRRTAALNRTSAENERLRAIVQAVEALADDFEGSASFSRRVASRFPRSSLNEQIALQASEVNEDHAERLRAVLARSVRPARGPSEARLQRMHDRLINSPFTRDDEQYAADDEGVRS